MKHLEGIEANWKEQLNRLLSAKALDSIWLDRRLLTAITLRTLVTPIAVTRKRQLSVIIWLLSHLDLRLNGVKTHTWKMQKSFLLSYLLVEKWTREILECCQIPSFKPIAFSRQTALESYTFPRTIFVHVYFLLTWKMWGDRDTEMLNKSCRLTRPPLQNSLREIFPIIWAVTWCLKYCPAEKNGNFVTYFRSERLPVSLLLAIIVFHHYYY